MVHPRVVGDGMIGRAFLSAMPNDPLVTFYAAGTSNSACTDGRDFSREEERLRGAFDPERTLVYFSTCSTADTPYVRHKRAMEVLVRTQPQWFIALLPNVVGRTPNPHTLFNYLYARISRGERFTLHRNAYRRIIDVDDVVQIVTAMLDAGERGVVRNVAPPFDYGTREIVAEFERVTGKIAVYDEADGPEQSRELPVPGSVRYARFHQTTYLRRTVEKYYG